MLMLLILLMMMMKRKVGVMAEAGRGERGRAADTTVHYYSCCDGSWLAVVVCVAKKTPGAWLLGDAVGVYAAWYRSMMM